jgi:hypothetical protein
MFGIFFTITRSPTLKRAAASDVFVSFAPMTRPHLSYFL